MRMPRPSHGGRRVEEPHPGVVEAARRGDRTAFEVLVRAHQADVWRLCLHLLGDRPGADDATQEAFVRVFRFLPRFRGEARFTTWLFSIARNCARDELRRRQRARRALEAFEDRPGPSAARLELGAEVRQAVALLPLDLREPLVMIDVLGRSYADTAATLGAPVGTIKSRVHRARAQLAVALGEWDEEARGVR
jgi:RNA polymerase sigma-70 factor (ECF subfamily)